MKGLWASLKGSGGRRAVVCTGLHKDTAPPPWFPSSLEKMAGWVCRVHPTGEEGLEPADIFLHPPLKPLGYRGQAGVRVGGLLHTAVRVIPKHCSDHLPPPKDLWGDHPRRRNSKVLPRPFKAFHSLTLCLTFSFISSHSLTFSPQTPASYFLKTLCTLSSAFFIHAAASTWKATPLLTLSYPAPQHHLLLQEGSYSHPSLSALLLDVCFCCIIGRLPSNSY